MSVINAKVMVDAHVLRASDVAVHDALKGIDVDPAAFIRRLRELGFEVVKCQSEK